MPLAERIHRKFQRQAEDRASGRRDFSIRCGVPGDGGLVEAGVQLEQAAQQLGWPGATRVGWPDQPPGLLESGDKWLF